MTSIKLDEIDQQLLNIIQKEFPIEERPFRKIAETLKLNENQVIERVSRLKEGIIRQISAIFDTKSLGYKSALVAASVEERRIDEVAEIINQHPGVTHNYRRNDEFNLWFTMAVPPDSKFGLEKSVNILAELAKIGKINILPTLKLYKIGVQFDMRSGDNVKKIDTLPYNVNSRQDKLPDFSEEDKKIMRALQRDLNVTSQPFDIIASEIGISVHDLILKMKEYLQLGIMRRYSGMLYHRNAGYIANGMGVWQVSESLQDEIGKKFATYQAVSHCYLRPVYPDWPFNIYTMVHGRSVDEVESIFNAMENETGIKVKKILYSIKEYKKTNIKYFESSFYEWEERIRKEGVYI